MEDSWSIPDIGDGWHCFNFQGVDVEEPHRYHGSRPYALHSIINNGPVVVDDFSRDHGLDVEAAGVYTSRTLQGAKEYYACPFNLFSDYALYQFMCVVNASEDAVIEASGSC